MNDSDRGLGWIAMLWSAVELAQAKGTVDVNEFAKEVWEACEETGLPRGCDYCGTGECSCPYRANAATDRAPPWQAARAKSEYFHIELSARSFACNTEHVGRISRPASEVREELRCGRVGCKHRWPS